MRRLLDPKFYYILLCLPLMAKIEFELQTFFTWKLSGFVRNFKCHFDSSHLKIVLEIPNQKSKYILEWKVWMIWTICQKGVVAIAVLILHFFDLWHSHLNCGKLPDSIVVVFQFWCGMLLYRMYMKWGVNIADKMIEFNKRKDEMNVGSNQHTTSIDRNNNNKLNGGTKGNISEFVFVDAARTTAA